MRRINWVQRTGPQQHSPKASSSRPRERPAATSNGGFSQGLKRYDRSLKPSNANEARVSRQALSLVRPEAKEAGSMRLEPGFGALRISRQPPDRCPERG